MSARTHDPRPAPLSSVVAVAVTAAVVLALSGSRTAIGPWVGLELVGLGVAAVGVVGRRRGHSLLGVAGVVVGVAIAAVAVGGFLTRTPALSETIRLLPGLVGVAVLAAALLPVRGDGSRLLVKAGAAALFAAVLLAGLFQTADLTLLLGATVGTVVAWDAGDNAVGIGEQLGRPARTWRLEVSHLVATAGVGVAGSIAVVAIRRAVATGLSLPAFAMVFLAVLLLLGALRW